MSQERQEQVSEEQISGQETAAQEPVSEGETPSTGEPSPDEQAKLDDLAQLVANAKEEAKREGQSLGDKAYARERQTYESQQQALLAELNAYRAVLPSLDEDQRARVTQNRIMAENQMYRQRDQAATQGDGILGLLTAQLNAMGVDPNDPNIDWAADVNNQQEGLDRFNRSVSEIVQKREAEKVTSDVDKKVQAGIQAGLKQAMINVGLETVDTTQGSTANTSDAKFLDDYGMGLIPNTKENEAKAKRLIYGG